VNDVQISTQLEIATREITYLREQRAKLAKHLAHWLPSHSYGGAHWDDWRAATALIVEIEAEENQ
jgi:hypothetical protein